MERARRPAIEREALEDILRDADDREGPPSVADRMVGASKSSPSRLPASPPTALTVTSTTWLAPSSISVVAGSTSRATVGRRSPTMVEWMSLSSGVTLVRR